MPQRFRLLFLRVVTLTLLVALFLSVSCAVNEDSLPTPPPPVTPTITPVPVPTHGAAPQLPNVLERNCQRGDVDGPIEGELAIDFTLKDTQGNEFTLSAMLAEKPVVMVFGSYT